MLSANDFSEASFFFEDLIAVDSESNDKPSLFECHPLHLQVSLCI